MSQNLINLYNFRASRNASIPPYNADPQLSITRHGDPDYEDSSDPTELYSSSIQMSDGVLCSSPPPSCVGDEPTDEDMTDDDEDNAANRDSTLIQSSFSSRIGIPTSSAVIPSATIYNEFPKSQKVGCYTNAFGPSTSMRTSSSSFIRAARSESSFGLRTPEAIVASVFDNEKKSDLLFDGLGLERIPDDVRDLIDHFDMGTRYFKMNFSNNRLVRLDRCIYQIVRLEFLDLRFNGLTELSPLIGNLINLRELHLGNNMLKSLPVELLSLPKLKMLTTYPNQFIERPSSSNSEDQVCTKMEVFSRTVSLQELAGRAVMGFFWDMSHADIEYNVEQWEEKYKRIVTPLIEAVEIGRICSICSRKIVEPIACHYKWARHVEDRSGGIIPFKTMICSIPCLNTFTSSGTFVDTTPQY